MLERSSHKACGEECCRGGAARSTCADVLGLPRGSGRLEQGPAARSALFTAP